MIKIAICSIIAHLPILLWAADVLVVPSCSVEIGDVVFRRGQGPWTRYFIDCSSREKRFSHVGIVVSNVNEVIIAHAEANDWTGVGQVHLQPWDGYFSGALEQAVFRYQGDETARGRIASEAEKMLGVPFDRLFDMGDSNRLYCTEFVRLAVNRAVGHDLIGFTTVCGRPVIAIDDIYRRKFIRVYDSKWVVTNQNSVVVGSGVYVNKPELKESVKEELQEQIASVLTEDDSGNARTEFNVEKMEKTLTETTPGLYYALEFSSDLSSGSFKGERHLATGSGSVKLSATSLDTPSGYWRVNVYVTPDGD